MMWTRMILAAALLAGACATNDSPSAAYVARLEESCREDLSARQCRCYANRLPQEVSAEELEYLAAQIDDPAKAEAMAARNPELSGMGLANRVLIAMTQCGPNRR